MGGGLLRFYKSIGFITPSTLRYIKVLSDLIKHFGDLNNKKIIEVGIGYGGQARIILSYFPQIESYTFIDLSEVLGLARKYLSHFELKNKLFFLTSSQLKEQISCDLFISNYAFSELNKNIQEIYINCVIKNAKNGYITYNEIAPEGFNYKLSDYEKLFNKTLKILEEVPQTHAKNKIIMW